MSGRPTRARKAPKRLGGVLAEAEVQERMQALDASQGAPEEEEALEEEEEEEEASDEEAAVATGGESAAAGAPAAKRRRAAAAAPPPPPPARAQLAELLERALQVGAFAAALATPDAPEGAPRRGNYRGRPSVLIRTPALAAVDLASLARAFGIHNDALAPAWCVLATTLCPGLPPGQAPGVYLACARGVICGVRQGRARAPIGSNAAKAAYELTKRDLEAVGAAKIPGTTQYDLVDVQRAAHRKHGDMGALARRDAADDLKRRLLEAEAARLREARREAVRAALEAAGEDAALADGASSSERDKAHLWRVIQGYTDDAAGAVARFQRERALGAALGALGYDAALFRACSYPGAAYHVSHGAPALEEVLARVGRCREAEAHLAGLPPPPGVARAAMRWSDTAFQPFIEAGAPALDVLAPRYLRRLRLGAFVRDIARDLHYFFAHGGGDALPECQAYIADDGGAEAMRTVVAALRAAQAAGAAY